MVAAAGIDVSEWHKGSGQFHTNPNFCYRWAFEGETTALLCLWLRAIEWVDGTWVCRGNARAEQLEREAAGADHWDASVRNRTKRWAKSAYQMDEVIKQAYRNKLKVRVCIVDSHTQAGELETSSADYRALDPMPWSLTYDMMTGDYTVIRVEPEIMTTVDELGDTVTFVSPTSSDPILAPAEAIGDAESKNQPIESTQPLPLPEITPTSYGVGVVDQFVQNEDEPDLKRVERYERERSAVVRQLVMERSQGCCEWCGQPGFVKHDGQVYLESHHVVPLHQAGDDTVENVIALCPNDHRMAHYGASRETMAIEMLLRIEERLSALQIPTPIPYA